MNDTISAKRKEYDSKAKILLAHKDIIANILKYAVKEFKDYSISEIISFLNGEPEIGTEEVDDSFPPKMDSAGSETVSANDGRRTYDIKFKVKLPKNDEEIELIINIESQYNYNPGYIIERRGIYYLSRMISSQYNIEFTKSDFNKLKKVYSIWICTHSPEYVANTITQYSFKPENVVGNAPDSPERYDLMSLIMINLGDTGENYSGLIRMLDVLLNKYIENRQAWSKEFEDEYKLNLTNIYEEVDDMCNLSQGIYNDGWNKGKAEGKAEGRAEGKAERNDEISANLREMGLTEEQIKQALKSRS